MNENRQFAILNWNKENNIVDMIQKLNIDRSDITIFYREQIDEQLANLKYTPLPEGIVSQSQAYNYINRTFKNNNFKGYLHVLEDRLDILRDPTQFINDIENMMNVLDLNSWLNTTTDICNRVYDKYVPRLKVNIDNPEFQKFNLGEIVFCSHSNTQWMIFNISKADDNELFFDEHFEIAMFYIIKYLAERRNTHPNSLYFMNQYITCKSEENLFKNKVMNVSDTPSSEEKMKAEDMLFRSMNINYEPTNNIDMVLEKLYDKLNSKI